MSNGKTDFIVRAALSLPLMALAVVLVFLHGFADLDTAPFWWGVAATLAGLGGAYLYWSLDK